MAVMIELLTKIAALFKTLYSFFVGLMAPTEQKPKETYEYILHIRISDSEDQDFYIAKKITDEPSLRIPDIVGIIKNPVTFKKSDNHTYLASILVDEEEAPQLLRVLTHMGFFLDDIIKVSEIKHGSK